MAPVTGPRQLEDAIETGHGGLHAHPYLTRLLGLSPARARASRSPARNGGRSAVPGAVQASAGSAWLEANADSMAAFTAAQATWRLPPLPELDQILARVLVDRFSLPSPAAAAWTG